MRYVLISLMLLVSSVFAQTAGEAEMAFNREYNEAKAVFDARVKAAQDKFVAVLKEELKRLTQKGDLDGAITVREKIKSLEDETKPVVNNTTTTSTYNLVIIKAQYGANNKFIDATDYLNSKIVNGKLSYLNKDEITKDLGDPLPGIDKSLIIDYKKNGKIQQVIVPKNEKVNL